MLILVTLLILNMTHVELAYERLLRRFRGKPFNFQEALESLGLKSSYVKNLLSELGKKGWLHSTPDPAEARRVIYRLDLAAAGEVNSENVQSMLGEYMGEYVLLVNGRIIDKDDDIQRLLRRALKKYKPSEIYITSAGRPKELVTVGF